MPTIAASRRTGRGPRTRSCIALRDRLAGAGLTTTALLIEGPAAEKIAAEARRLGCGLIVVGAHQRGLLGHWLHGSTSQEVLRDAPCPVLVVPVRR